MLCGETFCYIGHIMNIAVDFYEQPYNGHKKPFNWHPKRAHKIPIWSQSLIVLISPSASIKEPFSLTGKFCHILGWHNLMTSDWSGNSYFVWSIANHFHRSKPKYQFYKIHSDPYGRMKLLQNFPAILLNLSIIQVFKD